VKYQGELKMKYRIPPRWWPVLALASPVLAPLLLIRNRKFKKNRTRAEMVNRERMERAEPLDLPELDFVELTVLVEWKVEDGFLGDAGVSYLFRTDQGSLLFDIGFGPQTRTLAHNAQKLGVSLTQVDAVAISHLHMDHMGGMKAHMKKRVFVPEELGQGQGKPCYLPDNARAPGFDAVVVKEPQELAAGIFSTGPLARSLFFNGWTEEQALLARIKNKGLMVFTGCGHPTVEVILAMVSRLSSQPLYAFGGGIHFPVTAGRGDYKGIQAQMIVGTGMPPWQRITDDDLARTIQILNAARPTRVYLSAHDTCDHALKRIEKELDSKTAVLKAGASYQL
jgi:7,8-dihydropterin-6-yl-methyl-4-(beta-D-ribofuranosyl)aminobenzene 5'-phosphate synthase